MTASKHHEQLPSSHQRLGSMVSATGGIARLACARLHENGKNVDAILARVGASPEQVNDDSVRLEVPKQIRILQLAAEELGDDLLGFHLARNFELREIGLIYYVIASSERLVDAIQNGKRYCAIVNQGFRMDVESNDRMTSVALDYFGVDRKSDRHQIEFWLTAMVRVYRQVTGTRLTILHVKIRHLRNEVPSEFKSFFGCDVEFGAERDEIVLPAPVTLLPLVGRDTHLNNLLRTYAEATLSKEPKERTTLQLTIEQTLSHLLPHGSATIMNVAQELAISPRTLARRLRDEGVSFAKILEETRAALAKSYLAEPDLSITEITWLLGYQEVSSFSHAFKRWTGLTPRQFRLSLSSSHPLTSSSRLESKT